MQEETIEQKYILRKYTPTEDIPALSRLLTAVENYDHDGENTSEAELYEQLNWPNFDPEQACLVIEDRKQSTHNLLGYCSTFAQTPVRSTLYVAIHPAFRRQGLGKALLTKAIQRAWKMGANRAIIYANAHNAAANAFLLTQGFELAGAAWQLKAPADLTLQEFHWPAGYSMRSYAEIQNIAILTEAMNRSYADRWGHAENEQTTTDEVVTSWLATADPKGIFLVFASNGSLAGFCRAKHTQPSQESEIPDAVLIDEIEQPGIVPEHRHHDLYSPLILTAMHWLYAQKQRAIVLQSWGDENQTIARYQQIGFTVEQHFFAYRCNLHTA